ncbi:MAG: hypothetical protein GY679_01445 [Mycoplasma sp.]|nr:hypothetical protein [Mycoplasma sp.]
MTMKDKRKMKKTEELRAKAVRYAEAFNLNVNELKGKAYSYLKKYLANARKNMFNMMNSSTRREKMFISDMLCAIK